MHEELRKDLEERFDGWSSLGDEPLPGAWRNPEFREIELDQCWRYEVGIDADRLDELDDYLAETAFRLDQRALWRVVYAGGEGRAIPARHPPHEEQSG